MSPPKTSQLFIFFLLLFIIFVLFETSSSTNLSTLCPISYCTGGDIQIKYPFWLADNDHHPTSDHYYCGYPGFGLSCSNGKPVIPISDDVFYVEDMDYDKSTVTLVDTDVVNQTCPRVKHNLTLATLPLDSKSDININLSFYFNCTTNSFLGSLQSNPIQISCLGQDKGSYVIEEAVDMPTWWGSCEDNVMVAVRRDAVPSNYSDLISRWSDALQEGFVLDWRTVSDCGKCEASGGYCGFNTTTNETLCFCEDGDIAIGHNLCKGKHLNVRRKATIGVIVPIGSLIILSITFCLYKFFVKYKFNKGNDEDIETFISNYGALAMRRYSNKEIKKMTNSFKEKLGEGGFGSVYKGKLSDGRVVAVKALKLSKGNGGEFLNEVASISRTSHVNVVNLLGYCFESNKRVLIFEFMANGSLDKFIRNRASCSDTGMVLPWQMLYEISVGVARGLEYLHRGCNSRIVHFDIKPHNILLDEDFHPKISDFGLAKLSNARESIMSSRMEARGTIGYIAPEVFNRNFGNVSSKSDVYSYGMLLLDIIGARQRDHTEADYADETGSSLCYFPNGIYKQVELEKYDLYGSLTMEEVTVVKRMTLIGLWCIQTIPSSRPSMSKVIEMLEGSVEALETPPKPYLFSPPRLPVASSITSATESG